jgi:hypothetical protein
VGQHPKSAAESTIKRSFLLLVGIEDTHEAVGLFLCLPMADSQFSAVCICSFNTKLVRDSE